MKKILLILIFSLFISIPVILPYFHNGYFPTHDGEWAVVRLGDMFRTLRDFQIPARYSGELNFGYGYPLFNFAYPLPYYLGIIPYVFGMGFVGSIKLLFAASVILSAFFMFLASRVLWKNNWAGIASALLYVYFPYRMVDLYVRGSIGESLSFVLFPLLFYLAIKLTNKFSFLLVGGIAISAAALVMTHNIMTVLFIPIYIVFILVNSILKNNKAIKPHFISIVLGLGLSAFFWIPAIFEKGNILLSKIPIADRDLYFVTFNQLIFPRWGYGIPTNSDGFSYQLGLVHISVIIIFTLFLLFLLIKNNNFLKDYSVKIALLLFAITLFYIFLLFKPSEFLWENLPLLSEINYPWIILGILGFLISLIAGFLCKQTSGKYLLLILAIVSLVLVFPYAKPQRYINNPDSYYLTNEATTTSSNELMPLWVKKIPTKRPNEKLEIINGKGILGNLSFNSKQINFSVDALSQSIIRINTIYYPGWEATVAPVLSQGPLYNLAMLPKSPISYDNGMGVMDIQIPPGKHIVRLNFSETSLRLTSDIISILSIFVLLFLIIKKNKYAIS